MDPTRTAIKKLIAENKLKPAIEKFLRGVERLKDQKLENDLISFKRQLLHVNEQYRSGLISYSEQLQQHAIITKAVLETLEEVDFERGSSQGGENGGENFGDLKTILFLASNPADTAKLQLEKEFVRISTGLQDSALNFKLKAEWAVTVSGLREAILKYKPEIIHFSGHGAESEDGSGGIFLQDASANVKLVSGQAMTGLFAVFQRVMKVELVFLNACFSRDQVKGIVQHVPKVIGIKKAIPDNAAIEFATGFYRGLAENGDVSFAFDLGKASIQLADLDGSDALALITKEQNYF